MADTHLTHMTNLGVADNTVVGNLIDGSQLGVGLQASMLDSATPLVFPPTVLVVLQTPTMYDNTPEMSRMIKSIIESHAKTVSGIDFNYTLETADSPVGHDGQMMAVPTKSKRSAVEPSFVFQEVAGNLIFNIARKWITDIQHPDTNASMASLDFTGNWTMTTYAMSMMAIQFDMTMKPENILEAAFYTNMFPISTGDIGLERTISASKIMDRTINFKAIVQQNDYTRYLAKTIAEDLQIVKVNYNLARTGATEINSIIADSGLAHEVTAALANYTNPE